jgi:hypothetical protein
MALNIFATSTRAAFACASLIGFTALAMGCQSDSEGDDEAVESPEGDRDRLEVDPLPSNDEDGAGDPTEDDATGDDAELDEAASTPGEPGEGSSSEASNDTPPLAPALEFDACTTRGGAYSDCETLYVTIQQSTPPRCVQLTIDNCGGYNRRGLTVDTPPQWELVSGSIGTNLNQCELGEFYLTSDIIEDATGTISWDETTPLPTEVVFELSLELSGSGDDGMIIDVATPEPLAPGPCPEE